MDPLLIGVTVLGSTALALALAAGVQLWHLRQTGRARAQRLRQASGAATGPADAALPRLALRSQGSWSRWAALDRLLPRTAWLQWLERQRQGAGVPWPLAETLAAACGATLAVLALALAGGLPWPLALGATLAVPALLIAALQRRRARRLAQIDRQLPDALDVMARAMQAGHAFSSALQLAASETPMPLARELLQVFDEIHFGRSLEQTLAGLAQRVDSEEVHFFVTAVLIQRDSGGDLAGLLLGMASVIRERQRLAAQVRVLSAEGRLSAWVLSLLPLGLALAMSALNPRFMERLWSEPAGQRLVVVAALLWLVGVVWMVRLVRVRL
jgi:tight adherence protein B